MGSLQVVIFVFVLQQRIFINLHWRVESRITSCRGRVPLSKKKLLLSNLLMVTRTFLALERNLAQKGVKGEEKKVIENTELGNFGFQKEGDP